MWSKCQVTQSFWLLHVGLLRAQGNFCTALDAVGVALDTNIKSRQQQLVEQMTHFLHIPIIKTLT